MSFDRGQLQGLWLKQVFQVQESLLTQVVSIPRTLGLFLLTGNDEGVCTNIMVTHPAFAGASLKFHPLSLGAPNLFQDARKGLVILSVKICTVFFLNKCKLVFAGYH